MEVKYFEPHATDGTERITNLGIRELVIEETERIIRKHDVQFCMDDLSFVVETKLDEIGGTCYYPIRDGETYKIEISADMYRVYGEEKLFGTVRHELAHVETDMMFGNTIEDHHGLEFELHNMRFDGDISASPRSRPEYFVGCTDCHEMYARAGSVYYNDDGVHKKECPKCGGNVHMFLPDVNRENQKALGKYEGHICESVSIPAADWSE